jgi:diacylglycerol kinase family enzyme
MTKAFVTLNPVAGNSQPEILRDMLKRRFAEAGQVCEVYETTGEERICSGTPSWGEYLRR